MDSFDSDESSEEDPIEKEESFSHRKNASGKEGSKMEPLQCQAEQHSDEELINIWIYCFTGVYNCTCHISMLFSSFRALLWSVHQGCIDIYMYIDIISDLRSTKWLHLVSLFHCFCQYKFFSFWILFLLFSLFETIFYNIVARGSGSSLWQHHQWQ